MTFSFFEKVGEEAVMRFRINNIIMLFFRLGKKENVFGHPNLKRN